MRVAPNAFGRPEPVDPLAAYRRIDHHRLRLRPTRRVSPRRGNGKPRRESPEDSRVRDRRTHSSQASDA